MGWFPRRRAQSAWPARGYDDSYEAAENNPELAAAEAAVRRLPPPPPPSNVIRDVVFGPPAGVVNAPEPSPPSAEA